MRNTRAKGIVAAAGVTVALVLVISGGIGGATAAADPFPWDAATERTTTFKHIDGGTLQIVEGALEGGDDSNEIEVKARWSDGATSVEATLLRALCASSGWHYEWHAGKLFAEHGPCSRYEDERLQVTHVWAWDAQTHQVGDHQVERFSPYAQRRDEMLALLGKGKLMLAAELLTQIGLTPNGGHTYDYTDTFQAFFDATYRQAREAYEAGDVAAAAVQVDELFYGISALRSPACEPSLDGFVVIAEIRAPCPAFNELALTPTNTQRFNDMAFFMMKGGALERALPLLEQVVMQDPGRGVAHLNLADTLWLLGRTEQARGHYQAYGAWRLGEGKSVPDWVNDRIAGR